jgi:hypothetical protein
LIFWKKPSLIPRRGWDEDGSRLNEVVNRLARHLNKIFSGISATVALTPIPVSDIYVLLIIQAVLVSLIASLSGRDFHSKQLKNLF